MVDAGEKAVDVQSLARACAWKVAIGVPVGLGLLGILGKAIEQREALWIGLLWGVALGGQFWGAVGVAGVALAALAWACCVGFQLPEDGHVEAKVALLLLGLGAAALFVLANLALNITFLEFESLTTLQTLAVYALRAPLVIGGMAMIVGVVCLASMV